MNTRTAIVCAAVASAVAAWMNPSAARADDVAGSTLGPGDTYDGSGYILNGLGVSPFILQGFQFTAAASGRVTRVVVPIQHFVGQNRYFVLIASDNGGIPGTAIFSSEPVAGALDLSAPPVRIDVDPARSVTLVRGKSYWLVGACTENTQGFWHQNDHQQIGSRAVLIDNPPWTIDTTMIAAFRIEVTPVVCPADADQNGVVEPADVALFVSTWAGGLAQGTLAGDFDGNGVVEPADVARFVSAWLAAVANGC